MKKNKILIIAGLFVIFTLLFNLLFISLNKKATIPSSGQKYPVPSLPSNSKTDYSKLSKIVPGTSTLNDLKKINGEASRVKTSGNEIRLYYNAPFGKENPVLVQNNVVTYASEYVFGEYRGNYTNLLKAYGKPDITLYERGFLWNVFFEQGLAVQGSSDEIARIIYFVPNNQSLFYNTVFKDFNFSETPTGLGE